MCSLHLQHTTTNVPCVHNFLRSWQGKGKGGLMRLLSTTLLSLNTLMSLRKLRLDLCPWRNFAFCPWPAFSSEDISTGGCCWQWQWGKVWMQLQFISSIQCSIFVPFAMMITCKHLHGNYPSPHAVICQVLLASNKVWLHKEASLSR